MTRRMRAAVPLLLSGSLFLAALSGVPGQPPPKKEPEKGRPAAGGGGRGGFPGPGGPGGPGGFRGPPMGQIRKLVKQFDKDGDGRLNREERRAARAFLKKERESGGRGGFRRPRGGFGP